MLQVPGGMVFFMLLASSNTEMTGTTCTDLGHMIGISWHHAQSPPPGLGFARVAGNCDFVIR